MSPNADPAFDARHRELWRSAGDWLTQVVAVFGDPARLARVGLTPDISRLLRFWLRGIEGLIYRLVCVAAFTLDFDLPPRLPRKPRAPRPRRPGRTEDPLDPATWRVGLRFFRRLDPDADATPVVVGSLDPAPAAVRPARRRRQRAARSRRIHDCTRPRPVAPARPARSRPAPPSAPRRDAAPTLPQAPPLPPPGAPQPCRRLARRVEALIRTLADPRAAALRFHRLLCSRDMEYTDLAGGEWPSVPPRGWDGRLPPAWDERVEADAMRRAAWRRRWRPDTS
jgi:hypothetical protein